MFLGVHIANFGRISPHMLRVPIADRYHGGIPAFAGGASIGEWIDNHMDYYSICNVYF